MNKNIFLIVGAAAMLFSGCQQKSNNVSQQTGADSVLAAVADTSRNVKEAPAFDNEQLARDEAEKKVREVYDKVIATYTPDYFERKEHENLDKMFCSTDWLNTLNAVKEKDNKLEGEIGFFDADYWVMGQDFDKLKAENIKAEKVLPDEGKASVTLDWYNCGSKKKLRVDLVYENKEWKVDDLTEGIDTDEPLDWKEAMKEYLKE